MRILNVFSRRVSVCLLSSLFIASCVNHISEDDEFISDGNIPLKFVANIHEETKSRVAVNAFEEKDEVGLFALTGTSTLDEERYTDNLRFIRSSEGVFNSNAPIYYPDDGASLHLISYYPYQVDGAKVGESTMSVSVSSAQNVPANYSHSDFLIATQNLLTAPKELITLSYDHKFFKLKIEMLLDKDVDTQSILDADPELSVYGLYTKANYNFQEEEYTDFSEEISITPAGEWQISGNKLIGKEVILIPQDVKFGYQYIVLEVNGKKYTSFFPENSELEMGVRKDLQIIFKPSDDVLISKVGGEINDWGDGDPDQSGSEAFRNYVDISKLTFEDSNVYKVLSGGKQVAEICKEYLISGDFASQAIVVYPMNNDNAVDLTNGKVVQLLDQTEQIHGGSVVWNLEKHSLAYTPGTLAARNKIYILSEGQIALSRPSSSGVLPVLAKEDVLRDVRGGSIHYYPIVKIGTQYWMKSNLEASLYTDGEGIPKLEAMAEDALGYLQSKTQEYFFYSSGTIITNKIVPANWRLPNWADWNILKTYLNNDASLLKSGTWKAMSAGTTIAPATNLAGFDGIPIGMYYGKNQSAYEGKYVSYWTMDEAGTGVDEKVFLLKSDNIEIVQGNGGLDKAYAIRCIRK